MALETGLKSHDLVTRAPAAS